MYEDKTLVCRECGAEFQFSASEQSFFAERGFQNEPSRCPNCRAARRASGGGQRQNSSERPMYDVVCDNCGAPTKVPFQPRGDRPVYCKACYDRIQGQSRY
ncbi:MAG: zinc-ribbon domain containing protein [Oscillospiraceae bacterium]|nr:zinc-ribbon domain containing protein [Oscillospiraceae bacterium]